MIDGIDTREEALVHNETSGLQGLKHVVLV